MREGCCPFCGSYNDIGQRTIEINSMRQTYQEAVNLINKIVAELIEMLEFAGIKGEMEQFILREGE